MTQIDQEHTTYKRKTLMLQTYRDLYAGGFEFKQRAHNYLQQRQKEPGDIYLERLNRVFYENYIGSIVDWYSATLFRREPGLQFDNGSESDRAFLSDFIEDCDCRGTKLSTFFRSCFTDALVTGESHILVDFPLSREQVKSRAEEDAFGLSRAFLIRYSAEDLINWSLDDRGDYEWIVLRTECNRQLTIDSAELVKETRWAYYDKSEYRIYQRIIRSDGTGDIVLLDRGPHAMANQLRVPVISLKLNDGLWLLNKAALLQLEHFNKSNSLGWAITMGLFAMPVIYSDREWNQIVGGKLLHSAWCQRSIRLDRAGWQGVSNRRQQFRSAQRRDLPGLLLVASVGRGIVGTCTIGTEQADRVYSHSRDVASVLLTREGLYSPRLNQHQRSAWRWRSDLCCRHGRSRHQ